MARALTKQQRWVNCTERPAASGSIARAKAMEYFHIEAAPQFRVVATKLGPVKTKETRNSFMYGTRHLQPR
jgi:hypothetical protein